MTDLRHATSATSNGETNVPEHPLARRASRPQKVLDYVSRSPLGNLWNLGGIGVRVIAKNTWQSLFDDNLLGRAAELGFYFLFALFPTLLTACSILGLAARSASRIYDSLLLYLSIVVPSSALGTVVATFNQTAARATSGKVTFGLVAALWSASVGFSAIQGTLNVVYRVKEQRPYWKARLSAIGVTVILAMLVTLILASLLCGDFVAQLAQHRVYHRYVGETAALLARIAAWLIAIALLSLLFAIIYYFGPDVKASRWHWLTPGAAVGILGWILASLGFRVYLYFFNTYSASYGSLGAVIILLTWFYLSGLMLLLGGEINSEIEAAVEEKRLMTAGVPSTKGLSAVPNRPVP